VCDHERGSGVSGLGARLLAWVPATHPLGLNHCMRQHGQACLLWQSGLRLGQARVTRWVGVSECLGAGPTQTSKLVVDRPGRRPSSPAPVHSTPSVLVARQPTSTAPQAGGWGRPGAAQGEAGACPHKMPAPPLGLHSDRPPSPSALDFHPLPHFQPLQPPCRAAVRESLARNRCPAAARPVRRGQLILGIGRVPRSF
jgi:hypothetical protein